jgi:hypothetical protein
MAFIKCPECGKTFNDTEQACPNCGCPVSLMETQKSSMQSKTQNRMIALAIPIGILSLVIALTDAFDLIRHSLFYPYNSVITICSNVLVFVTFTLLLVWFLSLFRGSVKNSNMRKISFIAIVGIILFLVHDLIAIAIELLVELEPNIWMYYRMLALFLFGLKYAFFGSAFCALSKFFHGKLKTTSLLVGVGVLLRWLFIFIGRWNVLGFIHINEHSLGIGYVIGMVISILSYMFLALFFFGFSKSYKS